MLHLPQLSNVMLNGPALDLLTRLSASTFAVASTISVAALAVALKYGIEIYKLMREHVRDMRARQEAPAAALKAVSAGLREMERHHGQNLRVMLAIQRGMDSGNWLPMEYHVIKFAVMPMPLWATDAKLLDLRSDAWEKISKLARMIPNFQHEYDQALRAIDRRDRSAFVVVLKTLIIKARVAVMEASTVHQQVFKVALVPLEDLGPETADKPVDFYPQPEANRMP